VKLLQPIPVRVFHSRRTRLYEVLAVAGLAALGTPSCTSTRDLAVLPAVTAGPSLPQPSYGYLLVRSAVEIVRDADVSYRPHTGYEILDAGGHHLQNVRNRIGDHDEQPSAVRLPAGRYKVDALASWNERVVVPVQIESGRTTEVNLDRSAAGNLIVGAARLSD
jgi:hypothetical protein